MLHGKVLNFNFNSYQHKNKKNRFQIKLLSKNNVINRAAFYNINSED